MRGAKTLDTLSNYSRQITSGANSYFDVRLRPRIALPTPFCGNARCLSHARVNSFESKLAVGPSHEHGGLALTFRDQHGNYRRFHMINQSKCHATLK